MGSSLKRVGIRDLNHNDLLLTALYVFHLEGYQSLGEGMLHRLIYNIRGELPFRYQFLAKPLVFSYDLLEDMKGAREKGYVSTMIEVIDESVPRYTYELTSLGKGRAERTFSMLKEEEKAKIRSAGQRAIS